MFPRPQTAYVPTPETRALLLQAAGFAQAQEYDRAEAIYLALLEQAHDWHIARFQLGLLQLSSGRPAVAALSWQPLDRLPDEHPLKLFKTGFELLAQNEFETAIAAFERGIARNDENAPLNRDMAMVIDRIRQNVQPSGAPDEGDAAVLPTNHFLVSTYRKLN